MAYNRRQFPFLKVHKLANAHLTHNDNTPEINQNKRPEAEHPAKSERVRGKMSFRNLSG